MEVLRALNVVQAAAPAPPDGDDDEDVDESFLVGTTSSA
jgi:hypothetical protein